jgi:hypothetical protein
MSPCHAQHYSSASPYAMMIRLKQILSFIIFRFVKGIAGSGYSFFWLSLMPQTNNAFPCLPHYPLVLCQPPKMLVTS